VRHRRAVSVTAIFDQAVNMTAPNVTITAVPDRLPRPRHPRH